MKKGFYAGFALVAFSFCVSASLNVKNTSTHLERDTDLIVLAKDNESIEDLKQDIQSLVGFNYRVLSTYNGIANGIRIKVNSNYVSTIKMLDSVECASVNGTFEVSSDSVSEFYDQDKYYIASEIKNDSKDTMNVPTVSKEGEGTFLAVIDNGMLLSHTAFTDLDASTTKRVSKDDIASRIKSSGFKGESDINDCYYNSKIVYYYDYGNNDNDVYCPTSSHGMHTSSTAVANGDFKGIAPKSQLAFLKVGQDTSNGSTITHDALINAFNDCYYLGVDAISFSIGSALDESGDEVIINILNKLEDKGVIINVAAGNDGKGNWSGTGAYANFLTDQVETGVLGSYATYDSTTVVAAGVLDSDSSAESVLTVNGISLTGYDQIVNRIGSTEKTYYHDQLPFSSLINDGEDATAIEYVMISGYGNEEDYKGVDVKGKIAVIQRGILNFSEKISIAKEKGAVGCVIGNDENSSNAAMAYFDLHHGESEEKIEIINGVEVTTYNIDTSDYIPTYGVGLETFNSLKEQENKVIVVSKTQMTGFSSDGSLGNLSIKPEILSPGQNIIGAVSDNKVNNKYQYYDGTSMATPNYSGSVMLALGEYDAKDEEDRLEYARTLKNRFMSTANPIFQTVDTPTSVRRQGAGMVNVSAAISSDVYLKGTSDETKVELKNNENVQKGLLDFDVTFVNDKGVSATYTPTLYVTVPETVELDSETYPEYKGVKFQSSSQRLVKKIELSKVTLDGSSEQKYHVNYQIPESELKEILSDFPNGIQVEGYVMFESTSAGVPDLSIPYLGFLGDYTKGEVVEPFQFEKEDGRIYASDTLNSVFQDNLGLTNADFSSFFGVTSGGLSAISMEPICTHQKSLTSLFTPITATFESDGKYHLKVGREGTADTLYIQQFVNRSCSNNTITMTNTKGEVVLLDHMFDLFADDGDSDIQPLTKSFLQTSLLSSSRGYTGASRAYTIIALKDKANGYYYEDGNYNLKFSYTLMDGSIQEKEYVLEICSTKEDCGVESVSTTDDEVVLNFSVDMAKVNIGDLEGIKRSARQFVFKKSSLELSNAEFFEVNALSQFYTPIYGLITRDFTNVIGSETKTSIASFILRDTKNSDGTISLKLNIYDARGGILSLTSPITISYYVGSDVSSVKAYNSSGDELECNLKDGYARIVTSDKKVILSFTNEKPDISNNNGLIIGLCSGLVALIAVGVVVSLVFVKKNKKQ